MRKNVGEDEPECPHCGQPLDSPLARARGEHMGCVEKSGGDEVLEK